MTERTESNSQPEALSFYQNDKVLASLRNTDWFTPEFIVEVRENEPESERDGSGPFKDEFLSDFLRFGLIRGKLGRENSLFKRVTTFLTRKMISSQGHPYPLIGVPFADEEFMAFAKSLGADKNYEVDRRMIGAITPLVKCLIAPPSIRRKVVKQICRWGEGYEDVKRDTLLWAQLVKKGVKAYLKSHAPKSS